MSTILRSLRNLRKIGIREAAHQMQYIGDTKAGTYIATDKFGNKYYENQEQELPRLSSSPTLTHTLSKSLSRPRTSRNKKNHVPHTHTHHTNSSNPVRTRWVDYKQVEYDPAQIEPGWHAWMSYLVDKPPTEDAVLKTGQRSWEIPEHRPNLTASRAAFKTYST